jgi:hypothetical protein
MRIRLPLPVLALALLSFVRLAPAEDTPAPTPVQRFSGAVQRLSSLLEPDADAPPRTFTGRLEVLKAGGLPKQVAGQSAELALQGPDRLRLSVPVKDNAYAMGRDGQQVWLHVTDKKFGVVGKPGVPRFATAPEKLDQSRLGPLKLPLPPEQLALLPLLLNVESQGLETNDGARCHLLLATPKPEATQALKLPKGRLTLSVRESDSLPVMLGYDDGKGTEVQVRLREPRLVEPWPAERWKIPAREGDRVETTAVSHLLRFADTALGALGQKIPTLGPATGERRLVATEGEGRLEMHDGTRVLFLKGTPEEMGRQQGALLKKEVRHLVNSVLYGVGVGSSFRKGRWFFGEIEEAQARLMPFMDTRYVREMDAIALATRHEREEVRLANFFPELFHCSGFAVFGDATAGGKLYHGRVLDYLKGIGLEQNAIVAVVRPDRGHAWVNVGYAGFIGTVTAMNEKKVAIGEMGGRGEGNWDGKPMAQLLREVMEKASTLDEAVDILRKGPRTCEYYYVVTDGKTKRAVGIAATPSRFETVWAGESHPLLPEAVKDAVLLSGGDRYKELVRRVKAGYGKIDADAALDLMKRPVCMNSNIHSVLFEPETLDFWVANADSKNPASHTRFTRYNLADLLKARAEDGATAAAR